METKSRIILANVVPLPKPVGEIVLVPQPVPMQTGKKKRGHKPNGRGIIVFTAMLAILLPLFFGSVYYYVFAANQYVSEFKFSIRGMASGGRDAMAASTGVPALEIMGDAFVVTDFITSREIVTKVHEQLDLRTIYSGKKGDFLTRMPAASSIEDMTLHWRKMVSAQFDMLTGIISVTVRAFSPEDALKIAQLVVRESDQMFLTISERARQDSVRFANQDLVRTENNLNRIRLELREFRQQERILDATKTASANTELSSKLKEDLARMNAEVATVSSYLPQTAPQIVLLKNRIKSVDEQLRKLDGSATTASPNSKGEKSDTLPGVLAHYESLSSELSIAEKSYASALESQQRAQAMADRKATYLAVFVNPSLAQISTYPEKEKSIGILVLAAFIFWVLGALIIASIRDHLL